MGNLVEANLNIPFEQQLSFICVLDKGIIVNVSKAALKELVIIPNNTITPAIISNTVENNLMLFYLLLMQYLNQIQVSATNLLQYAENANMLKISWNITKQYIPKNSYFDIEGKKIDLDNAMELVNDMERFKLISSGSATFEEFTLYYSDNLSKILMLSKSILNEGETNISFYGKDFNLDGLLKVFELYKNMPNDTKATDNDKIICEKFLKEIYCQYKQNISGDHAV